MMNNKKLKVTSFSSKKNEVVLNSGTGLKNVVFEEEEGNYQNSKILGQPQTIFFNTCFDKNHLKTVIAWFLEKHGEKKTVDLVETLKQVGFHQATCAGVSLGIDDLKIPPQKKTLLSQASLKMNEVTNAIQIGQLTSVEKSQRLIDTWNQTSENLRQLAVHNFRTTNPVNPVYMMAFSGARGNISQVRQLVAMRGLMADPQGAILEFPIQSNFREGLTVTEYLLSCYGARKGLVDTALRTATSGYLTRRLVDAVQHVVVHVTDCQTKKGIVIKNNNIEERLIGRVLFEDLVLNNTTLIKKNTLVSPKLAKKIASEYKKVVVRSPLTCQTEKSVCQLCYGLDLAQGKLVNIGEAVGIIAAQSIGEPGTQLTMRTFHTGGVGVFSEQAMKSFLAPFDGKVEFLEPLSGLFVRTPHGNIVYLLKHKTLTKNKPILRLSCSSSLTQKSQVYEIMQSDVPVGSLLWVKQGEDVKTGQLLIQASRLQATTQEMPESSHPVRAPLSGEVFFQSMKIRVVEKRKKKQQTSSQRNQKEISPKFPTLMKLGNFWILSTFVQKENHFSSKFFRKGDLFSSETPIQQYNLKFLQTGQLKKVNSAVVFGQNSVDFVVSNIRYSRLFYCLQESRVSSQKSNTFNCFSFSSSKTEFLRPTNNQKTKENLLAYTSNSKTTLLTWYPFFKNKAFQNSGFCSLIWLNSDLIIKKDVGSFSYLASNLKKSPKQGNPTTKFLEKRTASINKKHDISNYQHLRYLWVPQQVFSIKEEPNSIQKQHFSVKSQRPQKRSSFCFVGCQTSKQPFASTKTKFVRPTGFYQYQTSNKIHWTFKKNFEINFVKNLQQRCSGPKFIEFGNKQNIEFVKNSLTVSQQKLFSSFSDKIIQKNSSWAYIPETRLTNRASSQLSGILLEPGKKFETLRFHNCYISTNLISKKDLFVLKSQTNKNLVSYFQNQSWKNTISELLNTKKEFRTQQSCVKTEFIVRKLGTSTRQKFKAFCFYKQEANLSFFSGVENHCFLKNAVFEANKKTFRFRPQRKRRVSHILVFQKASNQFISNLQFFKRQFLCNNKKQFLSESISSPLFTKQNRTTFESKQVIKPLFKILTPQNSGWFSFPSFFKIELKFNTFNSFSKTEQFKKHLSFPLPKQSFGTESNKFDREKRPFNHSNHLVSQNFSLFFYQKIKFQNSNKFTFFTFSNGWVLPTSTSTEAFLTSKKVGEFRGIQSQPKRPLFNFVKTPDRKQIPFSILQTQDQISFKVSFPSSKTWFLQPCDGFKIEQPAGSKIDCFEKRTKIGTKVRLGDELFEGFGIPISGQIIKTTLFSKNGVFWTTLTVRKGLPLLASIRGLVHISRNDLVEKNELLITLRSRRLQTEDIVQGIPKIEQLFEARETQGGEIIQNNIHKLLANFFIRVRQLKSREEAVQLSLLYIQRILVENILEAYSNQGVNIAEKHVEVVVRQMTARVRITCGGDTGLLPGEFVQLHWIQNVNRDLKQVGRRQAQYEPLILGITKSVLQSESFLLAASFQQVSKVLVRSALAKKSDFLRGLHENILVGQPIPAGTGIVDLTSYYKARQNALETSTPTLPFSKTV